MNFRAVWAIYRYEISKAWQVPIQSLAAPVITTSLYFVVFGFAFDRKLVAIQGLSYAAFIVPGLIMLSLLTESIANGSFSIFFQKYSGTIYEILAAPVSSLELVTSYVAATASKSIVLALCILLTAKLFVAFSILHPAFLLLYIVLAAATFSLLGFIIGVLAKGFERLQVIPLLIITPLTFLGDSFYSLATLPTLAQQLSLLNPILYLVNGLRWCFYGVTDVPPSASLIVLATTFTLAAVSATIIFSVGRGIKA